MHTYSTSVLIQAVLHPPTHPAQTHRFVTVPSHKTVFAALPLYWAPPRLPVEAAKTVSLMAVTGVHS
jgi:hypothetical protein